MTVFERLEKSIDGRTFWGTNGSGIAPLRDDTILLLRRSHSVNSGQYGIPGGMVEGDPKRSAIREFTEELKTFPSGTFLDPVYEFRIELNRNDIIKGPNGARLARDGEIFRYQTFFYEIRDKNWRPVLNWEHDAWNWFPLHDLPETLTIHGNSGETLMPIQEAVRFLIGERRWNSSVREDT